MSDNRFRDNTDEAEFEDLSLSEREEILRSEARRRYVARQEHQRRKKTQNTLATVGKIFVATLVIFIILAYILFNIVSDKKKNRDKGIKAFNKGDYEEAIDYFSKSIEAKQWFSTAMDMDTYFYLGDTYMRIGDYENAKQTYHLIQAFGSEKDKEKAQPYLHISDAMDEVDAGNYDMAVEKLKVEVDNGDTDAALYLGSCYYMMGENKKMLESYELYLKDNPLDSYLAYQISTYYLDNDNLELAKAYIDSGLNADTAYADRLRFNNVIYAEKQHDFDTAFQLISELKDQFPDVEEYQREYDFLYTRVNVDPTLSNQPEESE